MKKTLAQRGYGKEHLMLALGLFGAVTAKGKAVSAGSFVSASVLEVGAWAIIISTIGSRAGAALASLLTFFGILVTTKSFYYGLAFAAVLCFILFWVWFANLYRS